MEQYYSNDSLTAYHTEDGILIEEKKKGTLKMLVFILGMGILMFVGGLVLGILGGNIGRAVGPWLVWGGALVVVVGVVAFIIKLAMNQDPKITFNKKTQELTLRGKVIPFSDIVSIDYQEQPIMSKTMMFAFLMINGKKKSLFSTGIATPKPKEMINFISDLSDLVQEKETSKVVEEETAKSE